MRKETQFQDFIRSYDHQTGSKGNTFNHEKGLLRGKMISWITFIWGTDLYWSK